MDRLASRARIGDDSARPSRIHDADRRSCIICHALSVAGPESLVETARAGAAGSKVTIQKLRGNVSVLMGAGGNIAVLAGHDGKLLIDAGYVGARPRIRDALATINSDPIKHLIHTH